jgi:hypothetical protein
MAQLRSAIAEHQEPDLFHAHDEQDDDAPVLTMEEKPRHR